MAAYNVNPMQLVQMIKSGKNPQELMMSVLQQRTENNPLYQNLYNLAQNGKGNEIETIARTMFAEKGLDFDKEFNSFRQTLGL
jgi:hypothetical protein